MLKLILGEIYLDKIYNLSFTQDLHALIAKNQKGI